MRKLLISLLLASAAASPAIAGPRDDSDRDTARAERAERQQARAEARTEARSEHSERAVQVERARFTGQSHVDGANGGGQFVRSQHIQPNAGPDPRQLRSEYVANNDAGDGVRERRVERRQQVIERREQAVRDRGQRVDNEALRHSDRTLPQVMRTRVPVVSDVARPGTQPRLRVENRRGRDVRWSTNWRRDNRYDWRNWRERNRNRFRLGIYYDPFGWGYQPYSIGWRLWPSYYSSSFWINDPWQYRLPYAPPGTRWVRYYDDALLVDTYTGEVVDVIRNFFW
ncbi:MAG: RcnB family protein [Sphingomicrobium sp.]